MLKRFVLVLLTSILLFSNALPVHALTKEEVYQSSIEEFTAYMSGNGSMELEKLYENFESLGAYEWSIQFALYVDVLIQIENGDYEMIPFSLEVLRSSKKFCDYLTEENKDNKLGSIDELEAYVNGKQAEAQGDLQKAIEAYMNCTDFLDSALIILTLQREMREEAKAIEQKKEDDYQKAVGFMNFGTEEGYKNALEILKELADEEYKDSAALIEKCNEALAEIAKIAEQKRIEKLNEEKYQNAKALINQKTEEGYREALVILKEFPGEGYKDSAELINVCEEALAEIARVAEQKRLEQLYEEDYQKANALINENTEESYRKALKILKEIAGEGYKDSIELLKRCEEELAVPCNDSQHRSGDFRYILLKNGKIAISGYYGNASALEIPQTIDGYSVYAIGDRAFQDCDSLTFVSIPDSVTSIGDYAFFWCNSLTSVTIPDSVRSIGANPFRDCDKFTNIQVSSNSQYFYVIDGVLFEKTTKKLVCYPRAFKADSYAIPQGILEIGDSAFYFCNSLTSITIPDGVTSIGDYAFSWCNSLTSVTIPDSVTSIGDYAFKACHSLTSVTIPDSVRSIGENPFSYCSKLTNIQVSSNSQYFYVVDGVLFEKSTKKLVCYPRAFKADSYAIPQGILEIGDYAFYTCDSLTSITIPDGVTSIGDSAFYSCDSLTSVTIPDSVTSIGESAFRASNTFLRLYVQKGSYAEQYAKSNGLRYSYMK